MRKTRRNVPKRGGKFLGEGTYGCGFSPPLKCKGEATRRNASKLTKMLITRPEAQKEYDESRRILKIDPQRNYFLTADGFCEHDQTNIQPKNETSKCTKFPLRAPSFLVFYEMGGQNLEEIKIPVNRYWDFIRSFTGLLQGLALLHDGGMVHLDIKPPNIVSKLTPRGSSYTTRYIDFGLSSQISQLDPRSEHLKMLANFQLRQTYPWYPLDMMFGSAMFQQPVYFKFTDHYINLWYQNQGSLKHIIPMDFYYNPDGSRKLAARQISRELDINFYSDTPRFVKSVDCYSICVTLCQVYARLTGHQYGLNPDGTPTILFLGQFSLDELPEMGLGDTAIEFHRELSEFSLKFYNIMKLGVHWNGTMRASAKDLAEMLRDLFSSSQNPFQDTDLAYISLLPLAPVLAPVKQSQLIKHQEGKRQLVEVRPQNIPKEDPISIVPSTVQPLSEPTPIAAPKITGLPPGWEEVETNSGEKYYFNPDLDHTQWTKPIVGWIEHVNTISGDSYWEDLKTGKTQWNRPRIPPKSRKVRVKQAQKGIVIERNPLANLTQQQTQQPPQPDPKLKKTDRAGRFQFEPAFGF